VNTIDKRSLLIDKLRALRLIGMADAVADVLEQASKENITTLDVIDQLCDEKRQGRRRRTVDRRIKDAHFPELNTVDAFDFGCSPARR
jgi:DNA replication protein DnaC